MKEFIFCLIGIIITSLIIWGVIAFITYDTLWFIHSVFGRLCGIVLLIFILWGNLKEIIE